MVVAKHATRRQLTLDRIEIREVSRKEDGKLIKLALALPQHMTLRETDGVETKIELQGGKASTLVEAASGRGRESRREIASARVEQPKPGRG